MQYSLGSCLLVVAACGGGAAISAPAAPGNQGGAAPARSRDASLQGPFARLQDAHDLADDEEPAQITVRGRAAGPITVSLVEVSHGPAASSCFVTLETAEGVYVGKDFLCAADRSDEVAFTDEVSVSIEGAQATVRFRTSYQLEQPPAAVETFTLTCSLDSVLSCTPPPAIGGYE